VRVMTKLAMAASTPDAYEFVQCRRIWGVLGRSTITFRYDLTPTQPRLRHQIPGDALAIGDLSDYCEGDQSTRTRPTATRRK
jgi:hypothetical protein